MEATSVFLLATYHSEQGICVKKAKTCHTPNPTPTISVNSMTEALSFTTLTNRLTPSLHKKTHQDLGNSRIVLNFAAEKTEL